MIDDFRGKYYFLSNFYSADVEYLGIIYKNNEAAFQSQKDISRSIEFANLSASDAKRLGRRVKLSSDWELVRDNIMEEIVRAKFIQHDSLKDALLSTGDEVLIEGNTWGDTYWGKCNGVGKNKLGKILMEIRTELKMLP